MSDDPFELTTVDEKRVGSHGECIGDVSRREAWALSEKRPRFAQTARSVWLPNLVFSRECPMTVSGHHRG